MKIYRQILLILFFGTACFLSIQIYQIEQRKIDLKNDLIELSKIKYGLFNVDEWKTILADVITKKVEEFNLTEANRYEMRSKIQNFLSVVINDLEERYYQERSNSLMGWLESGVASVTGTFDQIKKDIPVFTDQIINFLNDPNNREAIRSYINDKIDQYADKTFSKTDYTRVNAIFNKYGTSNIYSTKSELQTQVNILNIQMRVKKWILIGISILTILIIAISGSLRSLEIIMALAISLVFLLMGVFLPMIEIDARISEITFSLLGEEVSFTDQVLYYKSKSILEVVELMLTQGRIDLMAVGLLVFAFSVLFPVSKLICSVIYLFSNHVNKIVRFMVLKSGKWSMADVMVVAIFMAYIGFDGIISEQLKSLEGIAKNLELLTTNNSNLLFGFYCFTIFVILSLTISQKISKSKKQQEAVDQIQKI
ncbi:MAG: hypothetical protein DWP94_11625 [Flavobacterium sp.]|nr:MAG: hypothetical protein DWP94_11625 [Flavobacterium sp.]